MFEIETATHRFIRQYGANLLADIEDKDFCHQPQPGMNHPAWIVGHLAFALDAHAFYFGEPRQLESWSNAMGIGSTVSPDPDHYPDRAELLASFEAASDRMMAAVESATPEMVAEANSGMLSEAFPTVGDFVPFSLIGHPSLHFGQLSAWRRADGRPALF